MLDNILNKFSSIDCLVNSAYPRTEDWGNFFEDVKFESNGITIFIDPKSLAYLDGTELDFVREGLNEGFKFQNPNVKDECGCGESFRV